MSITLTERTLQDILLDALSDAIGFRKDDPVSCRDCRNSPVDHCLDHERDYGLAVEYERAEALLRAASDPAALASIIAALGGPGTGETK